MAMVMGLLIIVERFYYSCEIHPGGSLAGNDSSDASSTTSFSSSSCSDAGVSGAFLSSSSLLNFLRTESGGGVFGVGVSIIFLRHSAPIPFALPKFVHPFFQQLIFRLGKFGVAFKNIVRDVPRLFQ